MPNPQVPTLAIHPETPDVAVAGGAWQVLDLADDGALARLSAQIAALPDAARLAWDLRGIEGLDHIGAQFLWQAWGRQRPISLALLPQHEGLFARIEAAERAGALTFPEPDRQRARKSDRFAGVVHNITAHVFGFIALFGQFHLDLLHFLRAPQRGPWREISAHIFHIGYRALGITALVGMLIGIVLSYLSSQQLRTFGGDVYLVNILGMSIIRELGPMITAILVAGRSGSSITAQLGVMRVTEELDAMLVMGMPHGMRLVLPRVIALALCMPLLVVWTDVMALAGGIIAAKVDMGMSVSYFLSRLPSAVKIENYFIGLGKGFVFGSLVALVACHFGLRVKPNTASLGQGTTMAVVTAITVVIVADAVFAIIFHKVGY